MPSKKKKFNSRFPPARIKKIMQTDEEVGKVAAAVPVIISRALELFVESLLTKAVQITSARNAKTLSPAHLKQCILAESRFDFLKDLVMAVPDVQGEGEEGGSGTVSVPGTPTGLVHHQQHPPVFIRSQSEASTLTGTTAGSSSSTAPRRVVGGTGRPRGRPRKNPVVTFQNPAATSRSRPSSSRKSGVTDSEDEEDSNESDDEDDEENSSDEDSSGKGTVVANRKTTQNGAGAVIVPSLNTPSVQFNAVQPNFYQEIGQNSGAVPPTGAPQPSAASFQIQINLPGSSSYNGAGLAGGKSNEDDDYDT